MSIEAGRETDIRITDEVMGGWLWKNSDGRVYGNYPAYSTDGADALEVVDRLKEAELHVIVDFGSSGSIVGVTVLDFDRCIAHAEATFPLAICRAALDPRVLAHLQSKADSLSPGPRTETQE